MSGLRRLRRDEPRTIEIEPDEPRAKLPRQQHARPAQKVHVDHARTARHFARLRAFGFGWDEIGQRVGMSAKHAHDLFKRAGQPKVPALPDDPDVSAAVHHWLTQGAWFATVRNNHRPAWAFERQPEV